MLTVKQDNVKPKEAPRLRRRESVRTQRSRDAFNGGKLHDVLYSHGVRSDARHTR